MDSWLSLTGAHQLGIAVGSISGGYCLGECKHCFSRKLHRKHVVVVGGELQNSSPTACVWRWYQKNWPVCPNKFETIPINCIEAHVSTPRPVWPVPYACAQPWAPIRAKQLSMAATAGVIWLCARARYWPYCGVGTCASVQLNGIVSKSLSQFKRLARLNFWFFKYYVHGINEKKVLVRLVIYSFAYCLGYLGLFNIFYTPDEFYRV